MKPSPDEKLKVEAFTNLYGSTPEDPYYDITNDSGDLSDNYSVIDPPDGETARRLVACWNACRGITTERLEIMADSEGVQSRLSSPTTPPTYTKAELDALDATEGS